MISGLALIAGGEQRLSKHTQKKIFIFVHFWGSDVEKCQKKFGSNFNEHVEYVCWHKKN